MTAGVRAGACIHAQRPRPGGTAAAARARRCGSRSDSGGGCHTGDMKTAASATGTQGACDAAAGALADRMPMRQRSGGDRTGRRRLPHGRWVLSSRNARAASRGRPVWLRSSAASVSPWQCRWQPLGLPHWGPGRRRRACHNDTATSLRSEDGVWQAFRRDAAAQRPPATVPKSSDGDAWR